MPPATATSRSPARTAWSTIPAERMPGGADLVDRLRGDLLGDPALDLRLAARDLALARLEHLAEHDVLDLLGRHLGALERGLRWRCRRGRWRRARRGRRPSSRTASARRRGSRSWASGSVSFVLAGAGDVTRRSVLDCRARCRRSPSARARGAPEDTAADTRVVGAVRGRVARRRARSSALVELGRGEARAEEGRGGARGRARRRPAPRADRRPRQARRASTPSRPAWRPPPRRRAPRSSARCRCPGPRPGATAWRPALVEGTLLKLYSFDRFKSQRERRRGRRRRVARDRRRRRWTATRSSAAA